jgi:hypothetical protein
VRCSRTRHVREGVGSIPDRLLALGSVLVVLLSLAGADAAAHPLAPRLLELTERGGGLVEVRWKEPLMQSSQLELAPSFQEGCHLETPATSARMKSGALYEWRMQCPASGLAGQVIGVAGLAGSKASVLLRVRFEDGRETQELLTGGRSEVLIAGESSQLVIALRYLRLGASHLFLGLDHLLFILCLVLLATSLRSLLVTVSAFTLGHATTLGLASLGLVNVSEAWVEVGITLSIVVLAAELAAARGRTDRSESRRSPLGRHPWVMATGFGLLHGLGFASALAAVGLPRSDIFLGLFAFNVGIELGQVSFILFVLCVAALISSATARSTAVFALRSPWPLLIPPRWAQHAMAYGIGTIAAYWCLAQSWALL